jgi:hypothetical protein
MTHFHTVIANGLTGPLYIISQKQKRFVNSEKVLIPISAKVRNLK